MPLLDPNPVLGTPILFCFKRGLDLKPGVMELYNKTTLADIEINTALLTCGLFYSLTLLPPAVGERKCNVLELE